MTPLEPATLERLRGVDASVLSDADKGIPVLDPGIRPMQARPTPFAGRAVTVQAHDDLLPVIEALHVAEAGDVLMIETAGATRAVVGEIFANEALRKGLSAIVIDGFCRDTATLSDMALPVWARGSTPKAAPGQAEPRVGVAVNVGGVDVQPGDLVAGDADGVLVAPPERLLAALPTAEDIQSREGAVLAGLKAGKTLLDGLTYHEHLARLRAGEDSSLAFRDPLA
jgi:regulator of RNase E activity RraA